MEDTSLELACAETKHVEHALLVVFLLLEVEEGILEPARETGLLDGLRHGSTRIFMQHKFPITMQLPNI